MEPRYQKYKNQSYQQYLVIQAATGGPPTVALCKSVRNNKGNPLTFPVLYDPAGALMSKYGTAKNEQSFVVGQGAKLIHKKQYMPQSQIEAAIDAQLAK